MKLMAARDDVDRADAVCLIRALGLPRLSVEHAIAPYVPAQRFREVCYELEDVWDDVDGDL